MWCPLVSKFLSAFHFVFSNSYSVWLFKSYLIFWHIQSFILLVSNNHPLFENSKVFASITYGSVVLKSFTPLLH